MSGWPVVAIDGPAGSGKSTTARGVGAVLGLPVLDTGAMYRAVALAALDAGIDLADTAACSAAAERAEITVESGTTTLAGLVVSDRIRGPEVTDAVSQVAAHPGVREVLVARQRAWVAAHGGGVVEGRDIGTVVFPDARVKVYLTARDEERARRRQRDESDADREVDVDAVRESLVRRDAIDSGRSASPLRIADDAMVVDTTENGVAEVIRRIVICFEERAR
jgi:cytidylate kinase